MSLVHGQGLALVRGGRLLFEGLDLDLPAGAAMQVTGPNGRGKSSLIRLVAGLLRPTAGRIECAPAALADESLALDRELPLARALAFWCDCPVEPAMAAMGIDQLSDVPVRILSTGQRKRAALARVMSSTASVWLLDEPLNGLDRAGADLLAEAIARHRAEGGAVLAASHVSLGGDWQELVL